MLTLVGDPWPPFMEGELGEDAIGGRAVELARLLFERLGDTAARFPLIPLDRALRGVETGECDGIMMLLKTVERERCPSYS